MTVFSGAFGHRWKLLGSKRQVANPAAADTVGQPLPAQRQRHSNSSNSTVQTAVSQQQQQQQQQLLSRAASLARDVANGAVEATAATTERIKRPPRQQIIIPGDAEQEKFSDEKEAEDQKQKSEIIECPTGKHKNKKDSVCSCILLAQFGDKVEAPVISEWHSANALAAAAAASAGAGGSSSDVAAAASAAAPGVVSLRDFKLARNKVFQGGQGVVYIVRRSYGNDDDGDDSGDELVMKFKERRKKQRTKSWKRDLREVFLLKDLKHPFIIDLKHAFLTNTFYCLVMDYGSRGSLWSLVCRHGCMPKQIAAYYVACILSAVRYVHKSNFIFRDLKAENVVVMPDLRPKLIDFGMAKSHNKPSVRNTSTSFYFAAYIAPEVYADPKGVTEKVDSWGIGYLTLELTVGLGVFKSLPWTQTKHTAVDWRFEMPKRYVSRITRDACRFIEKALDRRPEKRPSLDQLMDFQFLEDIDFRLLPTLRPKGMESYLSKRSET